MRFFNKLGDIAIFVAVALVVYVVGAALLTGWPMWSHMWTMVGFRADPVLAVVVVALVAGTIWVIARSRQEDVGITGAARCPQCRAAIEPDYVLCPECHTTLGGNCRECRRPLKIGWTRCPSCGVEVAQTGQA